MNLEDIAKFQEAVKVGDLLQVKFEKGMLFKKEVIETGRVTEINDISVVIDTMYKNRTGGGLPVGFEYVNYAQLRDYRKLQEEPKA
ncbi:MAG: hypothetical protein V1734_02945 [Nanoarchaeota archaeon]